MLEDLDDLTLIETVKTFPDLIQAEISEYPNFFFFFAILNREQEK